MKNLIHQLIVAVLFTAVVWAPSFSYAQESEEEPSSGEFQLAVPLLEGSEAPFSGILLSEGDFRLALEFDAAAVRWEREARVFERQLETERNLYESHIGTLNNTIRELSDESWWDENGNWFMLGLGVVLGIVASGVLVGLATD